MSQASPPGPREDESLIWASVASTTSRHSISISVREARADLCLSEMGGQNAPTTVDYGQLRRIAARGEYNKALLFIDLMTKQSLEKEVHL